jgi:hypothetical protein
VSCEGQIVADVHREVTAFGVRYWRAGQPISLHIMFTTMPVQQLNILVTVSLMWISWCIDDIHLSQQADAGWQTLLAPPPSSMFAPH